ncbi:MAG: hypothetical protein PUA90_01500 [bacterium]|nr:hypothetical protein [bacterium]
MKIYYIGKLYSLSGQNSMSINDSDVQGIINKKHYLGLIDTFTRTRYVNMVEKFNYGFDIRAKDEFNEIMRGYLDISSDAQVVNEGKLVRIVYEEIVRDDGIVYAKEISTGLIFPIGYKKYMEAKNVWRNSNLNNYANLMFKFPGMLKVETFVYDDHVVADYNTVEKYLKKHLNKDEMIKLYKNNVFDGEFKEKEKLEVISEELSTIADIKYYLTILKEKNEDLYNKRKEYFDEMLNNFNVEGSNALIGLPKIKAFKKKLTFDILFRNITDDDNTLKKSIDDFLNDKSDLDFDNIDYLCDIFLHYQNEIDIKNSINILSDFAKLYLLFILNNDVDQSKLENSHFKDLLNFIVIASVELKLSGVLNDRINLNIIEVNVENVLNEINRIKNVYQKSLK